MRASRLARRRPVDPDPLGDLWDGRRGPRALRCRARARGPARGAGDAREPRRDDTRPPARGGAERTVSRDAEVRPDGWRAGARRAARAGMGSVRSGGPHVWPHGELLAGDHDSSRGHPRAPGERRAAPVLHSAADRRRRRDPARGSDDRPGGARGRRLAAHRRPRRRGRAGRADRHRAQGRHDRQRRGERRPGRGGGGPGSPPGRAGGGRDRTAGSGVGRAGRGDRRTARGSHALTGGPARALRAGARALQGAQANRRRSQPVAPHAPSGKLLRRSLA